MRFAQTLPLPQLHHQHPLMSKCGIPDYLSIHLVPLKPNALLSVVVVPSHLKFARFCWLIITDFFAFSPIVESCLMHFGMGDPCYSILLFAGYLGLVIWCDWMHCVHGEPCEHCTVCCAVIIKKYWFQINYSFNDFTSGLMRRMATWWRSRSAFKSLRLMMRQLTCVRASTNLKDSGLSLMPLNSLRLKALSLHRYVLVSSECICLGKFCSSFQIPFPGSKCSVQDS